MHHMDSNANGWTLAELAQAVGGDLDGPADHWVSRPVPADSSEVEGIAFAESGKYLEAAVNGPVGALIVTRDADTKGKPAIRSSHPRMAFARLLAMAQRPIPINDGVHPLAEIHAKAWVDSTAHIGPFVVIEKNARIGARCRIHAGAYIGENCEVGEDVQIFPNVVLVQDVKVGARSILHAGCVIGADGFGFAWDGKRRQKIPQVGGVILGSDVEIGASACVDRATCGDTKIGDGTKLDNLVQFGHNSKIGEHGVIAGHTSVAGSVEIGDRAVIGGQSAIKEHLTLGNDVMLGGRTGVMQDILENGEYFGLPAVPVRDAMRQMAALQRLPDLVKRIKKLELELAQLKEGSA